MLKPLLLICALLSSSLLASELTVEEKRISKAQQELGLVTQQYDFIIHEFEKKYLLAPENQRADLISNYANKLWLAAKNHLQSLDSNYDDRSLYWARLKLSKISKSLSKQKSPILWEMERASRGQDDIQFSDKATTKVLITGFDPFFLDRNIGQSNPSGLAALMLDGKTFELENQTIQIESAIFPVRFVDFDHGEVELFLKPYIQNNEVDMIVTISMGRDNFDLERYPALRRSTKAPGNLNVFTGATSYNPLIPMLGKKPLEGSEFVEFSLPVEAMRTIQKPYKVNDRRTITTTEKTYDAQSLKELKNKISVAGSGGGYLSNEISYRSINLGNKLKTSIPIGHLHTPRIKGFEPKIEKKIVEQIEKIIISGALSLDKKASINLDELSIKD